MSAFFWWATDRLSRILAADERKAVLGDLIECGDGALCAFTSVLGLVARRQTAVWRSIGPWCGLFFVALPLGWLLCSTAFFVEGSADLYLWILRNREDLDSAGLLSAGLSLRDEAVFLIAGSSLLIAWSWTCGFVLRALSRSVTWLNLIAFCLAAMGTASLTLSSQAVAYQYSIAGAPLPLAFYTMLLPLLFAAVFVVAPIFRGVLDAGRGVRPRLTGSILSAALISAATLVAVAPRLPWQYSFVRAELMLTSFVAGLWPVAYLVRISVSKEELANGKNVD